MLTTGIKMLLCGSQSDSRIRRVLALHTEDPDFIPSTPYGSLSPPGVIFEYRGRNNPEHTQSDPTIKNRKNKRYYLLTSWMLTSLWMLSIIIRPKTRSLCATTLLFRSTLFHNLYGCISPFCCFQLLCVHLLFSLLFMFVGLPIRSPLSIDLYLLSVLNDCQSVLLCLHLYLLPIPCLNCFCYLIGYVSCKRDLK